MNRTAPHHYMAPATDTRELPSRLRGSEQPTRELHTPDVSLPAPLAYALRAALAPLGVAFWVLASLALFAGSLSLTENLDAIVAAIFGGEQ